MRNPNRIPNVLAAIKIIWEQYPDWRFGQLLENLKGYLDTKDMFYIEDDKFIESIQNFLNSLK